MSSTPDAYEFTNWWQTEMSGKGYSRINCAWLGWQRALASQAGAEPPPEPTPAARHKAQAEWRAAGGPPGFRAGWLAAVKSMQARAEPPPETDVHPDSALPEASGAAALETCTREAVEPGFHALVYGRARIWHSKPSDNYEMQSRWSRHAWWKAIWYPHRGPPNRQHTWGVYAGSDGHTGPGDAELTHWMPLPPPPNSEGTNPAASAARPDGEKTWKE